MESGKTYSNNSSRPEWEFVAGATGSVGVRTYRLKVDGGWLYRTESQQWSSGRSMPSIETQTFVATDEDNQRNQNLLKMAFEFILNLENDNGSIPSEIWKMRTDFLNACHSGFKNSGVSK